MILISVHRSQFIPSIIKIICKDLFQAWTSILYTIRDEYFTQLALNLAVRFISNITFECGHKLVHKIFNYTYVVRMIHNKKIIAIYKSVRM